MTNRWDYGGDPALVLLGTHSSFLDLRSVSAGTRQVPLDHSDSNILSYQILYNLFVSCTYSHFVQMIPR